MNNINWVPVSDEKPSGVDRVLVYTPESNPSLEYRIIPLLMLVKSSEITHWAYLSPPIEE